MVGHGLRIEMRDHRVEGEKVGGEERGEVVIGSRMGEVNRDVEMHGLRNGGFIWSWIYGNGIFGE
jgi:hypothetical protein